MPENMLPRFQFQSLSRNTLPHFWGMIPLLTVEINLHLVLSRYICIKDIAAPTQVWAGISTFTQC